MNAIGVILIIGLLALVFVLLLVLFMHKKSFNHQCWIGMSVGDNPDDAIFYPDRFKVVKKEKEYRVIFKNHKGKSYSPPSWVRVWKGKTFPQEEGALLNTDAKQLQKNIIRGAFFYRVGEEEYKPMKITQKGDLEVLDQDTTAEYLRDIEREKELTTSFREKLLQAGIWVASLVIIATFAILLFVLTTKFAGEQSAQILKLAGSAAASQAGVGG